MKKEEKIDTLALERYIGSNQFTVPTGPILELQDKIQIWSSMNACGAIVYGKSRSGKTRSIYYITKKLKEIYGVQLPVYNYCATTHTVTERSFYSSLLVALEHQNAHRGSAVEMKERIVNRIIDDSLYTKYRGAILFIDEAYLLDEREYLWLIDIYNELNLHDIQLSVYLFGTIDLKQQKTGFIKTNKDQIINRFMTQEYNFRGITSRKDIEICMASIDKEFSFDNGETKVILSQVYFPEAYRNDLGLVNYAKDLWDAFENVKRKMHIETDEFLMKHFMDTVLYCLKIYGAFGKKLYAPTQAEWEDSIINIGFTQVFL